MYLGLTERHEALRAELRAYYEQLLTPEILAEVRVSEGVGPTVREVVRQMGRDGWLGIGWPTAFGGQGRGPVEQFVFFDESMRAGAPVPMLTINSVAPTIMHHGSDEQKAYYLPKILAGELHFSIGYTEPDAGTDLAALTTTAVRDGEEFVINGTKVFTSLATGTDFVWLACRTDPDARKHKGISVVIVPTDAKGFGVQPIRNFGNFNTNITTYEDVRVPIGNLVGPLHGGWGLIVEQLNHERVTICSSGIIERALDDTMAWARAARLADGRRVIDQPWVRSDLAWVHAHLDVLRLWNWKVAWAAEEGHALDPAQSSSVKVFGTELYMSACQKLMGVMREAATVRGGSPDAVIDGRVADLLRGLHVLTFGGGTNEMQRDLITIFGLGMPGSPR